MEDVLPLFLESGSDVFDPRKGAGEPALDDSEIFIDGVDFYLAGFGGHASSLAPLAKIFSPNTPL